MREIMLNPEPVVAYPEDSKFFQERFIQLIGPATAFGTHNRVVAQEGGVYTITDPPSGALTVVIAHTVELPDVTGVQTPNCITDSWCLPGVAGSGDFPGATVLKWRGCVMGFIVAPYNTWLLTDWCHHKSNRPYWLEWLRFLSREHPELRPIPQEFQANVEVLLGGDPEFELFNEGEEIVDAEELLPYDGPIGADGSGEPMELRPEPAATPEEYVRNVRTLLQEVWRDVDAWPSIEGNHYPLGAHIHFNLQPSQALVTALDHFLGIPLRPLNGEARGSYDELHSWRSNDHGFEYRSLPATIYGSPRMVYLVYKVAKSLATAVANGKTLHFWVDEDDVPTRDSYLSVGGLTPEEYEEFWDLQRKLERDRSTIDLLAAWRVTAHAPARPVPRLRTTFRDDWYYRVTDQVSTALDALGVTGHVTFYGLAESRGRVATIPMEGCETIEGPADPKWIGVPWDYRQSEDFVEIIAKATAEWLRNRRDY